MLKSIPSIVTVSFSSPPKKEPKSNADTEPIAKIAIKTGVRQVAKGAVEGIKDAPYKVTKAAAGGAAILVANKLVEDMIGKEQNAKYKQAYNAYNKKNKIGQLPGLNKDDEDE